MHYETKSILDKIKGSIILATEEGEQEYVNIDAIPENLLDAEIVKNDLNADWVKEEVGRTGVEPGFF